MISTAIADKYLYEALFNHTYLYEIVSRESSQATLKEEKQRQIETLKQEIIDFEARIKRQKNLYVNGIDTYEVFLKEIHPYNLSIQASEKAISLLRNEIDAIGKIDIDEIIKTYKTTDDYGLKREFVNKNVNNIVMHKIDVANVKWQYPLHKNEKMVYFEIFAFGYQIPIKVLITPFSKNVIVSKHLQYLPDFNMVVDVNMK